MAFPNVYAAIVRVQSQSAACGNCASISVTLPNSTTAGDTLVVHLGAAANLGFLYSISDNSSNVWTKDMGTSYPLGKTDNEIWHASNIIPSANPTITVTISGAAYPVLTVVEYSGLASSNAFDAASTWQVQTNNGGISTSTFHSGFVLTTQPNELLFGGTTQADDSTHLASAGGGWATILATPGVYAATEAQDEIAGSVGSYEAVGSYSAAVNYMSG